MTTMIKMLMVKKMFSMIRISCKTFFSSRQWRQNSRAKNVERCLGFIIIIIIIIVVIIIITIIITNFICFAKNELSSPLYFH